MWCAVPCVPPAMAMSGDIESQPVQIQLLNLPPGGEYGSLDSTGSSFQLVSRREGYAPNVESDTPHHVDILFIGHYALSLDEPTMCAACRRYGHPQCVQGDRLATFLFCQDCVAGARDYFHHFESTEAKHQWSESHRARILAIKQRVREAVNLSSTVGSVVGGLAAGE